MVLNGFSETEPQLYDVLNLLIFTRTGCSVRVQAIIVEKLVKALEDPYRERVSTLPHLGSLPLAHPASGSTMFEVDVLIGADYFWLIVSDDIKRGPGPTAVESRLGYLLSGPLRGRQMESEREVVSMAVSTMEEFDISRFWAAETAGMLPEEEAASWVEVYQEAAISFKDGRYTAKFPWKNDHPELLSNYGVARRRTLAMIRRLAQNGSSLQYDGIIKEQLARGFIEMVDPNDNTRQNSCHYIPHLPVRKESSTTPLRVVYDCSCKTATGTILNDCLEAGPPLQNDMLQIIVRFRVHRPRRLQIPRRSASKVAVHT